MDIPAHDLVKAGYDPDDEPPYYRTWPGPRGSVIVQFYRER